MTARELAEYTELRATIRQRGSLRIVIWLLGLTLWGAMTVATASLATLPVATLLPLLLLAAVFEAVFSLHTHVERIGRYLQVFYEDEGRGWEHAAMGYGRQFGGGTDPLFTPFFIVATMFNFVPAVLAGAVPIEYTFVGGIHVLFIVRLLVARWQATHQLAIDLERFEKLKNKA